MGINAIIAALRLALTHQTAKLGHYALRNGQLLRLALTHQTAKLS